MTLKEGIDCYPRARYVFFMSVFLVADMTFSGYSPPPRMGTC